MHPTQNATMKVLSSLLILFILSLLNVNNKCHEVDDSGSLLLNPLFQPLWGAQSHMATAFIAQNLIHNQTQQALNILLSAADGYQQGYLPAIATFADNVRSTSGYYWSAPLHFVNTPSWVCEYDRNRDCKDKIYGTNMCVD